MLAYNDSVYSFDTRASVDSADSRVCLLSAITPVATEDTAADKNPAELDSIVAYQRRTQMPSLVSQRVQLTAAQRHNMQMAELASTVGRMGKLRFTNQEYTGASNGLPVCGRLRSASDIEGYFRRLDRMDVEKLNRQQRYSMSPGYSHCRCPGVN
ncbi:hypothetical protein H4R99_002845 [Coemansia sp. RSA 1722]|nr:hypothetical protein LPJ57_003389 [Coemansia sp. RSA 486]KAJ2228461.1 hypothetical protein IWW45_006593 [Coemansia sp. RSA 485]KAJ2601940.1 hypothetical protein H4R99_002845 [Coemansia sp. RSA 1722]